MPFCFRFSVNKCKSHYSITPSTGHNIYNRKSRTPPADRPPQCNLPRWGVGGGPQSWLGGGGGREGILVLGVAPPPGQDMGLETRVPLWDIGPETGVPLKRTWAQSLGKEWVNRLENITFSIFRDAASKNRRPYRGSIFYCFLLTNWPIFGPGERRFTRRRPSSSVSAVQFSFHRKCNIFRFHSVAKITASVSSTASFGGISNPYKMFQAYNAVVW